nr:tetratricopeptide repeat protein [Arenicellales bacterium]
PAVSLLQQTIADDPTNDRPKFKLAEWLLDDRRYEAAKATLDSISRDGKDKVQYRSLTARLEFGLNADPDLNPDDLVRSIEEDAGNLEARFQLANKLAQSQRLAEALDQLIEIIKRDKSFRDDAPRQTILKIFDLVGGKGDLVSRYRSLLAQALN